MASKYPNGGGAPAMTMAQRMQASNDLANAAAKAAKERADWIAQGESVFEQKYGAKPKDYVLNAKLGAYDKTSEASGFAGRSRRGKTHAREGEKKGTKGAVKAYHDMEEVAKGCARGGDIQGSIDAYHKAADMREAFEKKMGKAPDAGHAARVVMLRQRRNSLIGLKNTLDATDPDVVAAKLLVSNFFGKNGVNYPV